MALARLRLDETQLVIVDMQARLLPHIHAADDVVAQTVRLLRACGPMGVPVTVLEQYPRGLGRTAEEILAAAQGAPRLEKLTFSGCGDEAVRARIDALGRPSVLLAGVEAHVCVQKTALDLLAIERRPFVLADAVGSRRELDRDMALRRMSGAGVTVTTVEAAIFEMLDRCDSELFRRLLPIIKSE